MSKIKAYISAFRLRTLPLAFSTVLMGNILAGFHHVYSSIVGIMALVTTLMLQILSNVANDYGDAVSGADNEERIGPERMVVSGKISLKAMKNTVIVFAFLSLISGLILVWNGNFQNFGFKSLILVIVGVGAIAAAIKYTVGKNPYGYKGLGDIFAFLFFGWVAVVGTYFLHNGSISLESFLPASSIGLLSVGVLNLNNLRDVESDAKSGKITLIVKKGTRWGNYYHLVLLSVAMLLMILYNLFFCYTNWQWLIILVFPLFIRNIVTVFKNQEPVKLYPELKNLALATFFMSLLFSFSLFWV